MMSFKAFLATQDDTISDEDAIKKYADYKLEFKRQQLNEFFVSHKDEEWFKLKYHPEDATKRREEQRSALKRRIEVYQKFLDSGKLESVTVDQDQSDAMVKLLDSVVILLEGGSDFDLQALDREEAAAVANAEASKSESEEKSGGVETGADGTKDDKDEAKENGDSEKNGHENENKDENVKDDLQKAKDLLESNGSKDGADSEKKDRKRKRRGDDDSTDGSSSEDEDEDAPPGMDKEKKVEEGNKEGEDKKPKEEEEDKTKDVKEGDEAPKKTEGDEENDKKEEKEGDEEKKPRPLHKVTSIFLRNLSPTITKQEVEAMCKRYPGFLRAAIADPSPERRWFRRGWITFERDVKIKEVCFNLNNIRLRECELGPIVNRDLQRRIRSVPGITVDKKIVRNDIKIAAKVITNLDKRWTLWEDDKASSEESQEKKDEKESMGLTSNNPILANITDYLIEEASAEEEELLGKNNDLEDGEEGEEGNSVIRDAELVKVLDKLLFYLRIVHSVDFYNHSEYPNEDEMPNRCGIMHARGIPPTSNVTTVEIDEYCTSFQKKMGSFVQPRGDLTEEEAAKLGMKNEDDEVEKFVQANTQELGKDKWLCPLSGKKFKGPDFVRKHIFNKHAEKVEEVKKEVKYYNNYLKDPKRPQQYEAAAQGKASAGGHHHSNGREQREGRGHRDPYHYGGFPREATNYPVYGERGEEGRDRQRGYHEPRYESDRGYGGRGGYGGGGGRGGGRGGYEGGRGRMGGGDPYSGRPVITYRDLDAPRDDEF